MFIRNIEYVQWENEPNLWSLEDCTFDDVNLIVGKNASGKTMTLNIIGNLGLMRFPNQFEIIAMIINEVKISARIINMVVNPNTKGVLKSPLYKLVPPPLYEIPLAIDTPPPPSE